MQTCTPSFHLTYITSKVKKYQTSFHQFLSFELQFRFVITVLVSNLTSKHIHLQKYRVRIIYDLDLKVSAFNIICTTTEDKGQIHKQQFTFLNKSITHMESEC